MLAKKIPRQALPSRARRLRAPARAAVVVPAAGQPAHPAPSLPGRDPQPPAVFSLGWGLIISSAPSPAARHATPHAPPLIFFYSASPGRSNRPSIKRRCLEREGICGAPGLIRNLKPGLAMGSSSSPHPQRSDSPALSASCALAFKKFPAPEVYRLVILKGKQSIPY